MTLSVTESDLRVELTPFEEVLGLQRSFTVPRGHVVAARAVSTSEAKSGRGLRAPGTYVPGRIALGTWRFRRGTQFWAVRRAEQVLVVDLRDERYDRLVLEVPDPDRVVADLVSGAGREHRATEPSKWM